MTLSEYRLVLTTLTPAQRATFAEWEEAVESVEGNLAALATAPDRERYERGAVFHLRAAGVHNLMTEGEKLVAAVQDASYAAKLASISAERAALSAWWSVSAAVLTLLAFVVLTRLA